MPVTYDFCCLSCSAAFEVMGCQPGTEKHPCPSCGEQGERVWEPGSWSVQGTGIFKPGFDFTVGRYVESKSQLKRIAAQMGYVPKGTTTPRTPKTAPTDQDLYRAQRDLTREQVLRVRERREKGEWEDRNGVTQEKLLKKTSRRNPG